MRKTVITGEWLLFSIIWTKNNEKTGVNHPDINAKHQAGAEDTTKTGQKYKKNSIETVGI
jgi:hypothetical protein